MKGTKFPEKEMGLERSVKGTVFVRTESSEE